MFNPTRQQVRQFFCATWKKYAERLPLAGAEIPAAEIIAEHPEYHAVLSDSETAIDKEWTPESGQTNPFLHLSLHLAIAEQLAIDQPPGIRAIFQSLCAHHDAHEAEHRLVDCLGETLWRAQRDGRPLDSDVYLQCARRLLR